MRGRTLRTAALKTLHVAAGRAPFMAFAIRRANRKDLALLKKLLEAADD